MALRKLNSVEELNKLSISVSVTPAGLFARKAVFIEWIV